MLEKIIHYKPSETATWFENIAYHMNAPTVVSRFDPPPLILQPSPKGPLDFISIPCHLRLAFPPLSLPFLCLLNAIKSHRANIIVTKAAKTPSAIFMFWLCWWSLWRCDVEIVVLVGIIVEVVALAASGSVGLIG